MRSPFRSFFSLAASAALSLAVIVAILLGYNFLSVEYAKYELLEREQSALLTTKGELEAIRDQAAKDVLPVIPQPGTPANLLADHIAALEVEIGHKQVARQKLWDDHPIQHVLPGSETLPADCHPGYRDRVPAPRTRLFAQSPHGHLRAS